MSITKHLMFNLTWSKYSNEKTFPISNNYSDYQRNLSKESFIMNQFSIIQRTVFILSIIVLFWIIFIIIYMTSRLILRFISNFKHFRYYYDSPTTSEEKTCRAFVISTNQYGSFRPTCLPSPLLYRSDSLFSRNDFMLNKEQISQKTSSTKTNNTSLLEHYLTTYNPLQIDLTNSNQETTKTSIIQDVIYEEAPSDTDTRPIINCYALNCTNKQKQYSRLKEPDNCSATMSIIDDHLSDCSTKLTTITLPIVMVTDCSDTQRLHTDIIELNEDEKDK